MYSHRHTTPPSTTFVYHSDSTGSLRPDGLYFDSSPESRNSVHTNITTPPRSPIRQHGPLLLPKVRTQDQIAEPTGGPVRHRRTTSNSSIGYASTFNPYSRPNMIRRGSSPFANSNLASPATQSPFEATFSALNSPITFTQEARRASVAPHSRSHSRSHSTSAGRSHSRGGSVGSSEDMQAVIGRYGYPTYRRMPSYVTTNENVPTISDHTIPTLNVTTSFHSSYPVHEVSYTSTTTHDYHYSEFDPAPAVQHPSQYPLAAELTYDAYQSPPTTSLLEYLTSANPSPALVRRITSTAVRGQNTHFWFDVRNLRSWTDFNVSTITSIPGLLPLLEIPVSPVSLPEPRRPNLQPETEAQLHEICTQHYAVKVNAALKVAQGSPHMMMRPIKGVQPQQPEFISNYLTDFEKTISGEPRGRVVGLVKCYDQWNTGMRGESPPKQVLYLQGLAHLHRVMREHGCRYGFIMTEIELLCVRCGGPTEDSSQDPTTVNAQAGIPIFGYLEVSQPIRLSTAGTHAQTGDIQLTAALALWYLHMLAKEHPLPGMGSWRMDVGGPAALTRQNCLERDGWIPKPNLSEKRESKRVRGWVWPEEALSKKEVGRGRRKDKR
ncbi:hypothetical protein GQ43DRAFT_378803 [Delitschia confertaspora ATCC 74209]|uniref:Sialidase n=1 Tax=Delitschia confertaspora ATCC 74209 TaxID=1513339 RepID=A0A9P4MPK7_9PLEO|nr:hypothetical protein GQ43DRAFT_378803 [Delitschia confertaspora ATCC 74209]